MKSKNNKLKFYQNLAKIFYAIAKSDNNVKDKEVKVLKEELQKNIKISDDFFDTDGVYQIEMIFNWLITKEIKSEECYNDFIDYYYNNSHLFSEKIKKFILETSGCIASAFRSKNKSELILLAKLSLEFRRFK